MQETQLQKFKDLCKEHLVIYEDEYIDVIFGVIFANRLDSKPVWLNLIGPPGSGKTEILQALQDSEEIYPLSSLTANTLISGKIVEEGEPDPSLLPKLHGKVAIFKDFTDLLSHRRETLKLIIGQLRDAYDGTCRKVYGTGKEDIYKSKFGLIAGVTNAIDKHAHQLSVLGERFLNYRMPTLSEQERRERADMASRNLSVEEREEALKEAAHSVLANRPEIPELSDELRKRIEDLAHFVSKARCAVDRDRYTKDPLYPPEPEVPTRLMKQLTDLVLGIAMARDKAAVEEDEMRLVSKVAIDCIPANRIELLKCLLECWPAPTKAQTVADRLKITLPAVKRWLDDLYILDLADKSIDNEASQTINLSDNYDKPFLWQLKDGRFLKGAIS